MLKSLTNLQQEPTVSASIVGGQAKLGTNGTEDASSNASFGADSPDAPKLISNFPAAAPAAGKTQAVSEESDIALSIERLSPSTGDGSRDNHGPGQTAPAHTGAQSAQPSLRVLECNSALTKSEDYRINEANRRKGILEAFESLTKPHKNDDGTITPASHTKTAAAKVCGESQVTIWRWQKAFKARGFNGLLPDTDKCGRKTVIEKLGIPQSVINEIRGINLDTESGTAALRLFAQSDRCPEALANVILDPNRCSKHALPPSIRQLIHIPKNVRDAHRGARTLALNGNWTPRALDIIAGDIFCSDDTTPIWAWWVPWQQSDEYPFGVKVLQGQLLPVIDVASQKPLTFALIAREKSSYRACDIWSLFGHTFQTVGVPRLGFQLERGSWESNLIAGQMVEYEDGEVTMSRRVGGLRQLPTNITPWHETKFRSTMGENFDFPKTLQTWTSFLPKSKSIEAFFHRCQTLEGTLWGCLGRDQMRRPFEKMKKQFQACSRPGSKEDPRLHFLSQTELATRLMEIMRYIGNEPMEGEVFKGIPDQIWDQAIAEYPLLKLPEDMAWLYKRNWKRLQITQGWARVRLTDELSGDRYSLFYTNPTVFARHEGAPVVVYYDRENFEQPAQIILERTGEFLCEAKYFSRPGSFLAGDKTGHDIRKAWKNATMTLHATLVKHAPSRQLPPEIKARREQAKKPDARPHPGPLPQERENHSAPQGESVVVPRLPKPRAIAPAPIIPATNPDLLKQQRERLARQAQRANRIRQFQGDEA